MTDQPDERFRLSKYISLISKFSRKEAEKLINSHSVKVNGEVINSATHYVTKADKIEIDGKKATALKEEAEVRIVMLHKPLGFIVTRKDERNRKTIYDLLPQEMRNWVYVGRLDLNSEGLLLLTNTARVAHELEAPKNAFLREYRVRVYGLATQEKLERMVKGVRIEGVFYKMEAVEFEKRKNDDSKNCWLKVVLATGKNREVRRVLEYFNLTVSRLIRVKYGGFTLAALPLGAVFEVPKQKVAKTLKEIALKQIASKDASSKEGVSKESSLRETSVKKAPLRKTSVKKIATKNAKKQ